MKHLRMLRYVDEVARAGSIRKAADQLNVTASAVNRRIMDLEEELGAQLFERRPRGVRLTSAGEVFVHYLRQQSGDVERMKSQIEDLKGLRRGTVRIACSQALALDFLPREIAAYRAKFPLVQFDVKVFDHERAMATLAAYEVERLRRLSGRARRAQPRRAAAARRSSGALEPAPRHRGRIQLVRIPARHGAARQGDLRSEERRVGE